MVRFRYAVARWLRELGELVEPWQPRPVRLSDTSHASSSAWDPEYGRVWTDYPPSSR